MKGDEPAVEAPPPAIGQKRWKLYYDKMRRNYEDKGAPPHG